LRRRRYCRDSQAGLHPHTRTRYVGIEEQEDDGEPFEENMARLAGELSEMFKRSHELEDEIRKRLGAIGYDI
jgi:type I restriction enzyme M protein